MDRSFHLTGELSTLAKAAQGVAGHSPTRAIGGWATTYGKIGPDGSVVPTVDRENQVMQCARELRGIDWSGYLRKGGGFFNDTHRGGTAGDRQFKLGIGTGLEFHDERSPFAQQHGKVGWWTEGHLWDRDDPNSWRLYTSYVPSSADLDRADQFWQMATGPMAGGDRPLGFSVDGLARLSPCRKRIIWAAVMEIALALGPHNPDCTAEPMAKAAADAFPWLRRGLIGEDATPAACGRCSCGPNACGLLRKADRGLRTPAVPPPKTGTAPIPFTEIRMPTDKTSTTDITAALTDLDALVKAAGEAERADAIAELVKAQDEGGTDDDGADEDIGDEPSEQIEAAKGDDMDGDDDPDGDPDSDPDGDADGEAMAKAFMDNVQNAIVTLAEGQTQILETLSTLGQGQIALAKAATPNDDLAARLTTLEKKLDRIASGQVALAKAMQVSLSSIDELAKANRRPGPVSVLSKTAADDNAGALRGRVGGDPPNQKDARALARAEADEALSKGQIDISEHHRVQMATDPAATWTSIKTLKKL